MTMNSGTPFGDQTSTTPGELNPGQPYGGGAMRPADPSAGGQSGTNLEQARQQAGEVADQVKGAASQAKATVSDATRRTATQAKDAASRAIGQATDQAKQLTQHLTQQATEQGAAMFNDQKSRAAGSLGGLASALRCAADTLQGEQDKNLAAYTGSLAGSVEHAAGYLRDVEPRQLMNDASDFVRRRPEWVLGGAFIVGLALTRFLKASQSDAHRAQFDEYEYDTGGYDTGAAGYDETGTEYATSDQFMNTPEMGRPRAAGEYPGVGGTTQDVGPDLDPQAGARDFARTDATRTDAGPDVAIVTPAVIVTDATGTERDAGLNPDATPGDQRNETTNPSPGATL